MRRFAAGCLAIAGLAAGLGAGGVAQASARVDQSTTYQADAAHDGTLSGPAAGPLVQLWAQTLPGPVSYPVVAAGVVYVTASGPTSAYGTTLHALDAATGAKLWSHPLGGTYYWSALSYDAGRVFAVNENGLLSAFDAASGTLDWSAQLPGQYSFSSPPTAIDGIVYDGGAGSGGTLYANDERTGALIWTASVANGDSSSPAVVGGRLYVTYPDNYYAFDRLTGASDWVTALGGDGGGGATPVVADGHVYVRDWASSGRILSATDGSTQGPMASGTAPAVTGGVAYEMVGETLEAVAGDGLGSVSWSFAGDGDLDTAPIVFGGMVVVGSSNGALYGLDPATGAVVWTTTTGQPIAGGFSESSQPLSGLGAGGGTLFVPAADVLYAYASPTGPGPPVNRIVPSVDGVAQAAEQLAADVGVWTNDPTGYDYQWQRCDAAGSSCTPIFGAVGSAYTAADADVGGTLRVVVAASNSIGDGTAVVSAPTGAVRPARPQNLTPPSIVGTAQDGSSVQASTGTWSGSPTGYAYQWARCYYAICTPIPGATGQTYAVVADDDGRQLELAVTATNAGGTSPPSVSTLSATVIPQPPVIVQPVFESGSPRQGEVLSTSFGLWQPNPSGYAIQWLRCDTTGSGCAGISGATAPSYQLTAADVGFTVRVRVIASDPGGSSAPSTSPPTPTILPLPPINDSPPAITGTPAIGATLGIDLGSWTNQIDFFTVAWLRCDTSSRVCGPVAGADTTRYVPTAADDGMSLRVEVTAYNAASSTLAFSPTAGPVAAAAQTPGVISGSGSAQPSGVATDAPDAAPVVAPKSAAVTAEINRQKTAATSETRALGSASLTAPHTLRTLIRSGLIARVRCVAACHAAVVVTIRGRSAHSLVVVGRSSHALAAGAATRIPVAVGRSARADLLARHKTVELTASITLSHAGAVQTLVRTLVV